MNILKYLFLAFIVLELFIPQYELFSSNINLYFILWVILLILLIKNRCKLVNTTLFLSFFFTALLSLRALNLYSLQDFLSFNIYITVFIVSYNLLSKKQFIRVLQTAAFLISIYALFQAFYILPYLKASLHNQDISSMHHLNYILSKRRVFAFFPTANTLAGFLIFALPFTFYFIKGFYKIIYGVVLMLALYFTKSMGAIFCVFVGLINKKLRKKTLLIAPILIVVAALFVIQRSDLLFNNKNYYFNPFFQRYQIWTKSLQIIKSNGLLGLGLGRFPYFYNYNLNEVVNQVRYAHNLFLQFWIECGIIGFLWVALFYMTFFRKAFIFLKNKNKENMLLYISGLTFLIHNLIDFTFYMPQVGIIFFTAFALIHKEYS